MTSLDPVVIRIGHADRDNQQPFPPFNRLYEYTDFCARTVRVHRGDTVNFQTPPFSFHIVALSRDESGARRAYPIIELNHDEPPALGSGLPTISFGDGAFPVVNGSLSGGGAIHRDKGKGPPVVGAVQFGQEPGRFAGGDAVEVIGPVVGWDLEQRPATIDQLIVIDAEPGLYHFFDMLHPGMTGELMVVPDEEPVSAQEDIDAAAEVVFAESKKFAQELESHLESAVTETGPPGDRTFQIHLGASTSDGRVAIHRMMPSQLPTLQPGDQVQFVCSDRHGIHTVGFAQRFEELVSPFGFDCGNGRYQSVPNVFNVPPENPCLKPGCSEPKFLCDPGNAPSGSILTAPDHVVDSGLMVGTAFGVAPVRESWTVRITDQTAKGEYRFFDAVHPWMCGALTVG